jgi:hypothetical protein
MKIKEVSINNSEDYKRFIKRLWLYRSVLYKKTRFIIKDKTKNSSLAYVEDSLNIKKRRERIVFVFDKACQIIDDNSHDICEFQNGKCLCHRVYNYSYINGCCRKCKYVTDHGCSSKNVACKLFNCSTVRKKHKAITFNDLKLLKTLSLKNQTIIQHDYFTLREDVLKDLYTITMTYAAFRMVFRLIKNSIKKG